MPPDPIDTSLATARGLWQQSRVAETEAMLRDLLQRHPRRGDAAMLLAQVLRNQGLLSAASDVMSGWCRADGFEPGTCLRGASFAQQCDRHAVAAQILDAALARTPRPPAELLTLAGHVARESGDFAQARARYLAALDTGVDLERHHVLGALANTRHYDDIRDPDLARCERHFHDTAYSARSRASAGFGLAKIRNDLGDYPSAARILSETNAMVRAVQPWDRPAWRAFVDARMHEQPAPAQNTEASDFVPVFIVGVPRTGTTLTASLLARATGARDRGELRALRFVGEQLTAGRHLHDPAALAEARRVYRTLAVQDDAPAPWYLDQDPLNFRWLHIAAAMFPQARVIHLRRDRRDTALSLWSQDFAHPDLAFAYDFDDTAAFMAGHDSLMQQWRQTLSLPVFELDYEMLVADSEPTLARLRDFIGAREAASDKAGDSAPVQSASVWQARQRVYATSVGRWHHYARYVPELASFGSDPCGH